MHLLQAKAGAAVDETEAVDLGQTPGDIVFLSAADTELASLAAARAAFDGTFPSIRLANLMHLAHPMSVDTYVESVVSRAKLVVARVLGAAATGPTVSSSSSKPAPGRFDPARPPARRRSTGPRVRGARQRFRRDHPPPVAVLRARGPRQSRHLLAFAADLIGYPSEWRGAGPPAARRPSTVRAPGCAASRSSPRNGQRARPPPPSSSIARTSRPPTSRPSTHSRTRSGHAA